MLARDIKIAIVWTWLIVSGMLVIAAVAPFLFPADLLAGLAPVCEARKAGGSCILCGMTTAFLRIGSGDWAGALAAHRGSAVLWTTFLLNFVVAVAYCMKRRLYLCRPSR
jgi:hypothetical protein